MASGASASGLPEKAYRWSRHGGSGQSSKKGFARFGLHLCAPFQAVAQEGTADDAVCLPAGARSGRPQRGPRRRGRRGWRRRRLSALRRRRRGGRASGGCGWPARGAWEREAVDTAGLAQRSLGCLGCWPNRSTAWRPQYLLLLRDGSGSTEARKAVVGGDGAECRRDSPWEHEVDPGGVDVVAG